MSEPLWVSEADAIAVHDEILAATGGESGIRDPGLLRSALDRPRNKWGYERAGLAACAAAYAFGIARNHPFVDGNKRAGLATAIVFLAFNDVILTATPVEAADVMLDIAAGAMEESALAEWFAARTSGA